MRLFDQNFRARSNVAWQEKVQTLWFFLWLLLFAFTTMFLTIFFHQTLHFPFVFSVFPPFFSVFASTTLSLVVFRFGFSRFGTLRLTASSPGGPGAADLPLHGLGAGHGPGLGTFALGVHQTDAFPGFAFQVYWGFTFYGVLLGVLCKLTLSEGWGVGGGEWVGEGWEWGRRGEGGVGLWFGFWFGLWFCGAGEWEKGVAEKGGGWFIGFGFGGSGEKGVGSGCGVGVLGVGVGEWEKGVRWMWGCGCGVGFWFGSGFWGGRREWGEWDLWFGLGLVGGFDFGYGKLSYKIWDLLRLVSLVWIWSWFSLAGLVEFAFLCSELVGLVALMGWFACWLVGLFSLRSRWKRWTAPSGTKEPYERETRGSTWSAHRDLGPFEGRKARFFSGFLIGWFCIFFVIC